MNSGPFASCSASRTGMIVPGRDMHLVEAFDGLLPDGLTQAQCHSRCDVGDILAQDEHRIREFDFVQRR